MMSIETATTSGLKSADAAISAMPSKLHTIIIIPAAADTTLVIYDNATAASGTVLFKGLVKASAASETHHLTLPVEANKGIYADITGASAEYIIHYSLGV